MLKKILLAVALTIPFFGVQAQTLKIGVVDANALVQLMPERAEAETKIANLSKQYEAEYQKLGEEINRLIEDFRNTSEDTPAAIRERKATEITDKQNKIQQFETTAQQDINRATQEHMGPIIQKLRTAIEAVGKENGFSLIQDINPQITFYYAAPIIDVTPLVKQKLGIK